MPFIMVGTNKIARLDPEVTQSDIVGLGTFGLRTCVAAIVIGEKSKRISVTHYPGGLDRDFSPILKEIEWVGDPFIIRLAKNTAGMREGFSEISSQLNIKSEEDFKKYDTETLIIDFLKKNQLIKSLKSRFDTATGEVLVNRDGNLVKRSENTELKYAEMVNLNNAIEMQNGIYSKVLLQPKLEYDSSQFRVQKLTQPAEYMLNLVRHCLQNCEPSIDNIYLALQKTDAFLKSIGSISGAKLEIYGKEPSQRRSLLLEEIGTIIASGTLANVVFAKEIYEKIAPFCLKAKEPEPGYSPYF